MTDSGAPPVAQGIPPEGQGGQPPSSPLELPEVQEAIEAAAAKARQEANAQIEPHLRTIGTDAYKRLHELRTKGRRAKIVDADEDQPARPQHRGQEAPSIDEYFDSLNTSELKGRGVNPELADVMSNFVKKAISDALTSVGQGQNGIREEVQKALKKALGGMGDIRVSHELQRMIEDDADLAKGEWGRIGAASQRELLPKVRRLMLEEGLPKERAFQIALFEAGAGDLAQRIQKAQEEAGNSTLPVGAGTSRKLPPFRMPEPFNPDGTPRSAEEMLGDVGLTEEEVAQDILPQT